MMNGERRRLVMDWAHLVSWRCIVQVPYLVLMTHQGTACTGLLKVITTLMPSPVPVHNAGRWSFKHTPESFNPLRPLLRMLIHHCSTLITYHVYTNHKTIRIKDSLHSHQAQTMTTISRRVLYHCACADRHGDRKWWITTRAFSVSRAADSSRMHTVEWSLHSIVFIRVFNTWSRGMNSIWRA